MSSTDRSITSIASSDIDLDGVDLPRSGDRDVGKGVAREVKSAVSRFIPEESVSVYKSLSIFI